MCMPPRMTGRAFYAVDFVCALLTTVPYSHSLCISLQEDEATAMVDNIVEWGSFFASVNEDPDESLTLSSAFDEFIK